MVLYSCSSPCGLHKCVWNIDVLIREWRSKEFGFLLAVEIALSLARCERKCGELERIRHSKKYKNNTNHDVI